MRELFGPEMVKKRVLELNASNECGIDVIRQPQFSGQRVIMMMQSFVVLLILHVVLVLFVSLMTRPQGEEVRTSRSRIARQSPWLSMSRFQDHHSC